MISDNSTLSATQLAQGTQTLESQQFTEDHRMSCKVPVDRFWDFGCSESISTSSY
jgi:hypothetical protein